MQLYQPLLGSASKAAVETLSGILAFPRAILTSVVLHLCGTNILILVPQVLSQGVGARIWSQ